MRTSASCSRVPRDVQRHPLIVRITHWATALAVIVMIGSGWRIYDQEPIIGFISFPIWATLGGEASHSQAINNDTGFANAVLWHLAFAWLLVASFTVYFIYGLITRRFWREWLPVTPESVVHDALAAVTFKLEHRLGHYNAVQKLLYILVVLGMLTMVASGLAIWKPVQLWWLTALFGGFQGARVVHFLTMSGIALFIAVHVALALVVPKTIKAMVTGYASAPVPEEASR